MSEVPGEIRIIAFIEDEAVIKMILKHPGLWGTRNHDPSAWNDTHIPELTYDDDYSQIPAIDYWFQYSLKSGDGLTDSFIQILPKILFIYLVAFDEIEFIKYHKVVVFVDRFVPLG